MKPPSPFPAAPPASVLTSFIESHPAHPSVAPHHHTLALQVLYNLQFQHDWTSLHIHTHSPLTGSLLPRPLISGLPPRRIYVHPDQQVEELKKGIEDGEVKVETEWVLSTHLKEKWSLRRFAKVFDAVEEEPPGEEEEREGSKGEQRRTEKRRRGGKRILIATLGDDSTVTYYVVHDGIVKPRQN